MPQFQYKYEKYRKKAVSPRHNHAVRNLKSENLDHNVVSRTYCGAGDYLRLKIRRTSICLEAISEAPESI